MNTAKNALSITTALAALLLLTGCGLMRESMSGKVNPYTYPFLKTGAQTTVATAASPEQARARTADVIALRGAAAENVEGLLDELWQDGRDYAAASRGDDHAILVRRDTGIRVADAHHGRYASGRGSWAGAVLDAPYGTLTVVVTEVTPDNVGELIDVLAFAAGEAVVACGQALDDLATTRLLAEGFQVALETPDGDLLLARGTAN